MITGLTILAIAITLSSLGMLYFKIKEVGFRTDKDCLIAITEFIACLLLAIFLMLLALMWKLNPFW